MIARPLDRLIEWSVTRHDLIFAPSGAKDQPGIAFAHLPTGDVVWKAYAGGVDGLPKVEFFVRTLSPQDRDELRKRLIKGIGALARGGRGGVRRCPSRIEEGRSSHRCDSCPGVGARSAGDPARSLTASPSIRWNSVARTRTVESGGHAWHAAFTCALSGSERASAGLVGQRWCDLS